jgi:hypothetical protein
MLILVLKIGIKEYANWLTAIKQTQWYLGN